MKFEVEVVLIACCVDLSTGEQKVLYVEKGVLPSKKLEDGTPIDKAKELVGEHIDLSVNWVQLNLINVVYGSSDLLQIAYSCIVPMDTNVIDAQWGQISDINAEHPMMPCVLESARKI